MATFNTKRGYVEVRGMSPEGRVEKRFSKKKYGKGYKEFADKLYKELLLYELTGKTSDNIIIKPQSMTFQELAEGYCDQHLLNTRAYNNVTFVKTLILKWGKFSVLPKCSITKEQFRKWILYALDNPVKTPSGNFQYSSSSVQKLIHYCTAMFNWGKEQGVIEYENPLRYVRNDTLNKEFRRRVITKTLFVTVDEFWEFMSFPELTQEFRNVATVLWCTGMRRGELTQVKWEMIDGNMIHFQAMQTKEGYGKTVVVEPEGMKVIEKLRENKKSEYVFLNSLGYQLSPKTLSQWWKTSAHAYAEYSGIEKFKDITPHKIRDSYRTRKEQEGVEPAVVRAQLGHRSVRTSEHYNVVDNRRQQSIVGFTLSISENLLKRLNDVLDELFDSGIGLSDLQSFIRQYFLQWRLTKK